MNSPRKVPFNILDITIVLIAYIYISYTINYLLIIYVGNVLPNSTISILSYAIQIISLLVILLILNKKYSFKSFSLIGFKSFSFFKAIKLSIFAYITYLTVMSLLLYSTVKYNYHLPGIGEQEEHISLFGDNAIGIILLGITAIIIAPLMEEILFRGYILTTINKYYSTFVSILISSILFATVHLEFQVFIPLLILGIILGYLRTSNNNIYYSIIFHVLNNSIAFIAEIFFKLH